MIETLYGIFKGFPVIGPALKTAFITKKVKDCVTKYSDRKLDPETSKLVGGELDKKLKQEANEFYNEEIGPIVKENEIPEAIEKPIKDKAIQEMVNIMSKKIKEQITTKDNTQ